jgi:hypothetical protein
MIPVQQMKSGETGAPNTVVHVIPMQPFAVQYFDEHGKETNTIVYKMGDTVYFDRNAERWAAGLAQAASYIKDAVNAENAAFLAPPTPGDDAVDVLAQEEASAQDQATPE